MSFYPGVGPSIDPISYLYGILNSKKKLEYCFLRMSHKKLKARNPLIMRNCMWEIFLKYY